MEKSVLCEDLLDGFGQKLYTGVSNILILSDADKHLHELEPQQGLIWVECDLIFRIIF